MIASQAAHNATGAAAYISTIRLSREGLRSDKRVGGSSGTLAKRSQVDAEDQSYLPNRVQDLAEGALFVLRLAGVCAGLVCEPTLRGLDVLRRIMTQLLARTFVFQ